MRMRIVWSAVCALVGALATASPVVRAQSPVATTLILRVVDSAGASLPAVELELSGERKSTIRARTDSLGAIEIANVAEGLRVARLRRIGFAPAVASIRVATGMNSFTLRMVANAVQLTGVRIIGGAVVSKRLDDFERRRLSRVPSAVVSREEIDRLAPVKFSRLIRGMAGLVLGDSLGSVVAMSARGLKPTPQTQGRPGIGLVQCVLRVSIDGILMPALYNIDEIVPSDVHGVEVYFGPARMPPELAGLRTDSWCGLVAIWTRDR